MKARMLLAESASMHQDGTFSVLRAGITNVWGDLPVPLQGVMIVRIQGEMTDLGPHKFDLRGMDEDGVEAFPKLEGQFDVPKGGGLVSLMLNFQGVFPKHGAYVFVTRVDDVVLDEWRISVAKRPEEQK